MKREREREREKKLWTFSDYLVTKHFVLDEQQKVIYLVIEMLNEQNVCVYPKVIFNLFFLFIYIHK
jgi:hypothetical protein